MAIRSFISLQKSCRPLRASVLSSAISKCYHGLLLLLPDEAKGDRIQVNLQNNKWPVPNHCPVSVQSFCDCKYKLHVRQWWHPEKALGWLYSKGGWKLTFQCSHRGDVYFHMGSICCRLLGSPQQPCSKRGKAGAETYTVPWRSQKFREITWLAQNYKSEERWL